MHQLAQAQQLSDRQQIAATAQLEAEKLKMANTQAQLKNGCDALELEAASMQQTKLKLEKESSDLRELLAIERARVSCLEAEQLQQVFA